MRKEGFLKWIIAFLVLCIIFIIKVYYEMKGYKVTGLILLLPFLLCIYLANGHIKFPKTYKQLPLDKIILLFVTCIFLVLMSILLIYFLNIPIDFLFLNIGIISLKGIISAVGLFWIVVSLQVYYVWDNIWFYNEN